MLYLYIKNTKKEKTLKTGKYTIFSLARQVFFLKQRQKNVMISVKKII